MSDTNEGDREVPVTAANTNGEAGAEALLLVQPNYVGSPINRGSEYEEISLFTSR